MACVLSRDSVRLFISYAPGTGSTSLEQHIRTHESTLYKYGFEVQHYPPEEFGQGGTTRHICYSDYLISTGDVCSYIATGIRNPFSYYYAEYNRILSKWCHLLDDPDSWIYKNESASTLRLTSEARSSSTFDEWFYQLLVREVHRGYLSINENHLNKATHFIKTEDLTNTFDAIGIDVFSFKFSDVMGCFPIVNASEYYEHYSHYIDNKTKALCLVLFSNYMRRFGYSFSANEVISTTPVDLTILNCEFYRGNKIEQGDLFSLTLTSNVTRYIERVTVMIKIFDERNHLAFSKTLEIAYFNEGKMSVLFYAVANLPVGAYFIDFTFNEFVDLKAKKLNYHPCAVEFQILSAKIKYDDGYMNIPSSLTFIPYP